MSLFHREQMDAACPRRGFKFADRRYSSLVKNEADAPYAPGKTRRLPPDEAANLALHTGPGLHYCESATDCLLYLADADIRLGQSVLDPSCTMRLLRVTVPDDAVIQRVAGPCARKCAATALHVDCEVTDRRELTELFRGSVSLLAVVQDWSDVEAYSFDERRFDNGRYVAFTKTDIVNNVIEHKNIHASFTWAIGMYRIVGKEGVCHRSVRRIVAMAEKCADASHIAFVRDGAEVVKTYAVAELAALVADGMKRASDMFALQQHPTTTTAVAAATGEVCERL